MARQMSINPQHEGTTAVAGGILGVIKWFSITVLGSLTFGALWETAVFAFVGATFAFLATTLWKFVAKKYKAYRGIKDDKDAD